MTIYSIYLITCLDNGKPYVGQTKKTLRRRWIGHKSDARRMHDQKICRAIRKYGENNFTIELLETCDIQERADELERHYIAKYNSIKLGYNVLPGGHIIKGAMPDETKAKISKSKRGHKYGADVKARMSEAQTGEKNGFYGKKHTPETKAKISMLRRGEGTPTAKLTEENVREIRKLLAEGYFQQEIADRFGVHNSIISRIKTGDKWKHVV